MRTGNKSSVVPEAYLGDTKKCGIFTIDRAMDCVFSYHCNVELLISNHVRVSYKLYLELIPHLTEFK